MPGPTLEELEGVRWGEPEFESHLVVTCHRLRKKPVDAFAVEDLRIMIGQSIGLPHLLPLAEGDHYPGDLLSAVLHADRSPLLEWPELLRRIIAVTFQAEKLITVEAEANPCSVEADLLREIQQFRTDVATK
jgi:hypothetical protein